MAILPAVVGLLIGVSYGYVKVTTTRDSMELTIARAERRNDLFKRKIAEQKALTAQLRRAAGRLEQEIVDLAQEVEVLKIAWEEANTSSEELEARIQKNENRKAFLKKEVSRYQEDYSALKTDYQVLQRKHAVTVREQQALEKKLVAGNERLRYDLEKSRSAVDICRKKNGRLCMVTDEIIDRFYDKGIGSLLMEKEPLTQLKKVEFERVIQTYEEQIRSLKQKGRLEDPY